MNTRWLSAAPALAVLLLVINLVGCTTPQPKVKPDTQADVFRAPPDNLNNAYPKQAFNDDSPGKKLGIGNDPGNGLTRAGGPSMMGPANFGGPMR